MASIDLETVSVVAQVMTAIVLVQGMAWWLVHARLEARRRRDTLALEAVRIMQDDAASRAVQVVLSLPDSCTSAQLAIRGPEVEHSVRLVEHNFDTLGWMVHKHMIPLRDLDDLMGGAIRAIWRRVHVLAEERRHVQGQATDFEWTQWLAEKLESHPSPAKQSGAHNYYRRWRP